jgi:arsenate reductase
MQMRERAVEDLAAVKKLLTEGALPLDGLEATRGWVAFMEDRVVGHVAVEEFAASVILRSLMVSPEARGQGIARALLRCAEQACAAKTLYLRTRTVNAWVERLGYLRIPFDQASDELKTSPEFSGSICSSVPIYRKRMVRIFLFACIHNAGRSQMAAAWLNQLADPAVARAISAGTEPAAHVHPVVLEAMREVGLDLTHAEPCKLTAELAAEACMLITMGCGENCPFIPGLEMRDWLLPDPKGQGIETVRNTRDEIRQRVEALLDEFSVPPRDMRP